MRSTTKQVKNAIQEHILEHFTTDYGWSSDDAVANLKQQLKSFDYLPSDYARGKELVQGGTFLCYYNEQRDFLNDLGINPDGKEYSNQQVFDQYVHLLAREISTLVK